MLIPYYMILGAVCVFVLWYGAGYITIGDAGCVDIVDFGPPDSALVGCLSGR